MNGARVQSTLDAATGSDAALIHELGVALYVGGALIFLLVACLALYATFAAPARVDARRWLVGWGLVFPVVTLAALLWYALAVGGAVARQAPPDALRVHVIGKQWWWEVRYEPGPGATSGAILANELHLPVGQPVEIVLETSDVIHSFWVPALAGKVDMIPGHTNRLVLEATEPGIYRGQCAEYCGGQHALMAFYVIAEPPEQFAAWLAREAKPATTAAGEGYALFVRGGCAACHAIRGTEASGTLGPDLTHVGSRHSLGAGVFRNHVGTLAGWIAGTQDLKPGNAMPSTNVYTGRELRTIAQWLAQLK